MNHVLCAQINFNSRLHGGFYESSKFVFYKFINYKIGQVKIGLPFDLLKWFLINIFFHFTIWCHVLLLGIYLCLDSRSLDLLSSSYKNYLGSNNFAKSMTCRMQNTTHKKLDTSKTCYSHGNHEHKKY